MSISAVLVVKNEEKRLARALKSLNFVDEIVVFDMLSTDRTQAVAKKLKAHKTRGRLLAVPGFYNFYLIDMQPQAIHLPAHLVLQRLFLLARAEVIPVPFGDAF